jgi:hypothetical protein
LRCVEGLGFLARRLVKAKYELAADRHGAQFGVEAFAILVRKGDPDA